MGRTASTRKISSASLTSTLVLCTSSFTFLGYTRLIVGSQYFPDQVEYFPKIPNVEFATQAILQGGDWINLHAATSTL